MPWLSCRTLTTPTEESWPGVTNMPDYKPTFPCWKTNTLPQNVKQLNEKGLDLLQVGRHRSFLKRSVTQIGDGSSGWRRNKFVLGSFLPKCNTLNLSFFCSSQFLCILGHVVATGGLVESYTCRPCWRLPASQGRWGLEVRLTQWGGGG